MSTSKQLRKALSAAGELVASHGGSVDLSEYSGHRTAISFTRDELGETDPGPWSHQREVMELVAHNDRVAWRGAQGVGKDWAAARIAVWWTYAVGGLTLISGPTARQVQEIIMRKEIARAFRRSGLPGELYTNSLRLEDQEAGVLAFTSSEASGLTGFHDAKVLAILTEAQAVDRAGWEGLMACTTGADDKLLAVGNPLEPVGRFYEISRPDSGWATMQTAATDHPNMTGECFVPGGPSEEWMGRMDDMWGKDTPMWTARVGGEFPTDAVEGLYKADWIDEAIERSSDPGWTSMYAEEEPALGVDVARHGLDQSAAAWRRGPHVVGLETWSGASTTETTEKVEDIARRVGIRRDLPEGTKVEGESFSQFDERPYGDIVVDAVGIGAGVVDNLEKRDWPAGEFKASKRAKGDSRRFRSARDEAYWTLRELLEEGGVALPDDRLLREELLSVKWSPDAKGKVVVESKDAVRKRIGRSPDRLDSVLMCLYGSGTRKRVTRSVSWFG